MKQLSSTRDLDEAVGRDVALVYKHSFECPISAAAKKEVDRFLERNPDAPLFLVDVNESTDVSEYLAEKSGIGHASPQMILFRGGEPKWSASHYDIRADDLEERMGGASA